MHDVVKHKGLDIVVLVRVGVGAVDNDIRWKLRFLECLLTQRDADRVIVWLTAPTAEDNVPVLVALGLRDGNLSLGG